jgi:aspartate kinase
MKFGEVRSWTSTASAVSRSGWLPRTSGHGVVGVLAAMASTTSELVARTAGPPPTRRARARHGMSVGERASCALAAMALVDLGYDAVSLTGSQAGSSRTRLTAALASSRCAPASTRALDRGAIARRGVSRAYRRTPEVTTLRRGPTRPRWPCRGAAAEACEILGTAGGSLSADARLVPGAPKLATLSHDELLEIASCRARAVPPLQSSRTEPRSTPPAVVVHRRRGHLGGDGGGRSAARERSSPV